MKAFSDIDRLPERIESLKAGTVAAFALLAAFLVFTGCLAPLAATVPLPTAELDFKLLLSSAFAFFSGFLFGVTYRYVIRTDSNPHLKSGAVLAFGLVRALAQVDAGLRLRDSLWPLTVLGSESVAIFAIAGFALDVALQRGWVKPFQE